MSKNLRGYSGMQPIINLVDITASSITATNGTFTNLSIGTYTITTLNVNNLVATGTVILSGLTQQNPLNTDNHNILIHDPTTNRLYKFNSLYFSPINDRLYVPKLTVEYGLTLNADAEINSNHDFYFREILPAVGGDKGVIFWENIARIIGRRTSAGLPELQLVNNTARQSGIDYQISLQDTSTQLNTTNTINFRINNAIKMTIDNSNITFSNIDLIARDIDANDVTVNGTLNAANITFTSANVPGGLTVGGLTDLNGDLQVAGSVELTQMALPPQTFGYGINVLMWDAGTRLLSADNSFKYYGSTDTLEISNLNVVTAATIFNLNVTNDFVQFSRLADTTSDLNFNIQFINSSNKLRENTALRFNPFTETLRVGNIYVIDNIEIAGDTTITAPQPPAPSLYNNRIPFIEGSTDTGNLESFNLFTFNPTNQVLNTPSISTSINITNAGTTNLNGTTTVTGNIDLQGDTTISAISPTISQNSRILFIDGNGATTGKLANQGNLYYNPSSKTLVSQKATLTEQVVTPKTIFTLADQTNGEINLNATYGMFYTHDDGHVFRKGPDWKLRIGTNESTFYHNLQIRGNTSNAPPLVINNSLTEASYDQTTKHHFEIGGASKFYITNTDTTVKNTLNLWNTTLGSDVTSGENQTINFFHTTSAGASEYFGSIRSSVSSSSEKLMQLLSNPNPSCGYFLQYNSDNGHLDACAGLTQNDARVHLRIKSNIILGARDNDGVHIFAPITTGTDTCPILFGRPTTVAKSASYNIRTNTDLNYNASTSTLTLNILNVRGTTAGVTPLEINNSATVATYNQTTRHSFQINGSSALDITGTDIFFNRDMSIYQNQNFTLYELSTAFGGVKNEINFYNLGRIRSSREVGTLYPRLDIFNETASNFVDYQLRCNIEETLINTGNQNATGSVKIQVDTTDKIVVTSLKTTINNRVLVANNSLTVFETIRYGSEFFYTPLNYTYIIGNTDLIQTIDVVGSGVNNGKFGQGVYLSIERTGVKATAFGSNADLISWNAYVLNTNTPTQWTVYAFIAGIWEITVTCDYKTDVDGTSNRVNPIMRLELNGTEIEEGTQSLYIRHQLGRVATMRTNHILRLSQADRIKLKTYVNYGGALNYSSLIAVGDFELSNFYFRATFLGPLDEYDRTP